jgi:DNA-binding NarL/FixJ family response regulator
MAKLQRQTFLSETSWTAIVRSLRLSTREAEVVELILCGQTETGMALALKISRHTVHTHLERLYRKLGVTDRCQVVVRIFQQYVELLDQNHEHAAPTGAAGVHIRSTN